MGTTWSVRLAGPAVLPAAVIREDLQDILDRLVAQMSTWRQDSVLSGFNHAAAPAWHPLPEAFFTVLDCALELAEASGGAFDPTMGALTRLWGFGPGGGCGAPPPAQAIEAARARCGYRRLRLEAHARAAWQCGGLELDLSGIAKGYAVDGLAAYLDDLGIDHYLVEVGGELRGRGCKPDGSPWWVGVELLEQTIVALHDLAIATSGDSHRYFEHGGRRYSHTLDPRTGRPVAHDVAAVTVLHPQCMRADALATVLMVLGRQAGLAYARRHAVAALFVVRTPQGLEARLTPALQAFLPAPAPAGVH
jgi:thiamine biosynthesis lipoprotein